VESLENLPGSLVEVADAIGLVNCLALVALYGGRELYIPACFPDSHAVVTVLGREIADNLSARFSGSAIDLARGDRFQQGERNQEICQKRAQRVKVSDLARKYHLTERRIYGILRRNRRAEPEQLSLFDQA